MYQNSNERFKYIYIYIRIYIDRGIFDKVIETYK